MTRSAIVCMAVPKFNTKVSRIYYVPAGPGEELRLRTAAKVTTAAVITEEHRTPLCKWCEQRADPPLYLHPEGGETLGPFCSGACLMSSL